MKNKFENSTEYPKKYQEKIKTALESGLYSQVVMIWSQTVVDKNKDSSCDHKIKYFSRTLLDIKTLV